MKKEFNLTPYGFSFNTQKVSITSENKELILFLTKDCFNDLKRNKIGKYKLTLTIEKK